MVKPGFSTGLTLQTLILSSPQCCCSWTYILMHNTYSITGKRGPAMSKAIQQMNHREVWFISYGACPQGVHKPVIHWYLTSEAYARGSPGGSVVKNPPAKAGDTGFISDAERSYVMWRMKLTFSSPVATAESSKFAGILSAALSQHHLSGFETAQLECHHLH